jgi:hypothetical protein
VGLSAGVDNVIDALKGKVKGHVLNDGAEAGEASTDGEASETRLCDGSVNNTLIAIFLPQSLGNLVGSIVLCYFLSDEEDSLVTLDFFVHGCVDCFTYSHLLRGRSTGVESSRLGAEDRFMEERSISCVLHHLTK